MPAEITDLLIEWNKGSTQALNQLMPFVERELRRIAANHMRRESPDHILQTTALVNEAYLRLIDQRAVQWQNRAHFFALASKIMRRVLLDYARKQRRAKRGGDAISIDLEQAEIVPSQKSVELIALDEALTELASFDPRKSQIVEMRFFGGLGVAEVAEVTGLTTPMVNAHWRIAKAWLQRELRGQET